MKEDDGEGPIVSKEEVRRHVALSRAERYYRTAYFVQSKWFLIIGALAIGIMLALIFLIG